VGRKGLEDTVRDATILLLGGGDEVLFVQDQLRVLAKAYCGMARPYQNAYYGVMIGILVVVGHAFYNAQQIEYEIVVHGHCSESVVHRRACGPNGP
jgi:hypothetical protein